MSERTYTAEEMEHYAQELVRDARRGMYTSEQVTRIVLESQAIVLKTLLRSLEGHQRQRRASVGKPGDRMTVPRVRAQGEVIGLQVAIDAVKRRIG